MTTRRASCSCGQLSIACEGEPVRISMCHCLECQKRTGSPFGVQARFPRTQVTTIKGKAREYERVGEEGGRITFRFCPECGSTLYWSIDTQTDLIAIAVGAFADPNFPAPFFSVYERRRHPWVDVPETPRMQRLE
jgi:hypothetical protein